MRKLPFTAVVPLLSMLLLLPGCMGESVGRQLLSSLFTQGADQATGAAIEAHERYQREQAQVKYGPLDEYSRIFARAQFRDLPPPVAVEQPLPKPSQSVVSRLVPVEVWGFVVGEEKASVLERMRRNGSQTLPNPAEWENWRLATGTLAGKPGSQLYFLVPPKFGRIGSGEQAIVEISGIGALHVARYRVDK